jgi:hypothetical protein
MAEAIIVVSGEAEGVLDPTTQGDFGIGVMCADHEDDCMHDKQPVY